MTNFSPKSNFQTFHPAQSDELKKHREDSWLTVAFAYSLAEMANLGATAEQMNGARNFIHVLQNLWEKAEQERKLPIQRLETYEMTAEQLIEAGRKLAEKGA